MCLEHRAITHCTLLDFVKAFNSVPHKHLLFETVLLGFNKNQLKWTGYFLTQRFQCVVIIGTYLRWKSVKSGIPQGSVLCPIFFVLFINDFHYMICLKLFADDVAIYQAIKSIENCLLMQQIEFMPGGI